MSDNMFDQVVGWVLWCVLTFSVLMVIVGVVWWVVRLGFSDEYSSVRPSSRVGQVVRAARLAEADGVAEDWGSDAWYSALARHGVRIDDPDLRRELQREQERLKR